MRTLKTEAIRALNNQPHRRKMIAVAAPVIVGGTAFLRSANSSSEFDLAILTVTGIVSAFFFQLLIQLLDRSEEFAASRPRPSKLTSRRAERHRELGFLTGYAGIVSVVTALASAASAIAERGIPARLTTSALAALGVHLVVILVLTSIEIVRRIVRNSITAQSGADRVTDRTQASH